MEEFCQTSIFVNKDFLINASIYSMLYYSISYHIKFCKFREVLNSHYKKFANFVLQKTKTKKFGAAAAQCVWCTVQCTHIGFAPQCLVVVVLFLQGLGLAFGGRVEGL